MQPIKPEHRCQTPLTHRREVEQPYLPARRLVHPPTVALRAQCQYVVPRHERSDEQRHRAARQRAAPTASITCARSTADVSSTSHPRYRPAAGAWSRSHRTAPQGVVPSACGQNLLVSP